MSDSSDTFDHWKLKKVFHNETSKILLLRYYKDCMNYEIKINHYNVIYNVIHCLIVDKLTIKSLIVTYIN